MENNDNRKNPTEKLLEKFQSSILSLIKNIIIFSVDLGTFNFSFFRNEINPVLLKVITHDFNNPEEGVEALRELYRLNENSFNDMDKLAIYLYNRFYSSKLDQKYESELLKGLGSASPETISLYTGKKKLNKEERERILSGSTTLREIFTDM